MPPHRSAKRNCASLGSKPRADCGLNRAYLFYSAIAPAPATEPDSHSFPGVLRMLYDYLCNRRPYASGVAGNRIFFACLPVAWICCISSKPARIPVCPSGERRRCAGRKTSRKPVEFTDTSQCLPTVFSWTSARAELATFGRIVVAGARHYYFDALLGFIRRVTELGCWSLDSVTCGHGRRHSHRLHCHLV